ncbi:MAG: hypothetical protein ACJ71K_06775 [Nitrososphaeraceae archaeon]|jgi:hypothetical protein
MRDSDNDNQQIILDLAAKSLKTVTAGKINIDMEGQPAININVDKEKEKIKIDFIHPTIIETESGNENRPGLFDKLKTAKEFAQKLTDNGLTLAFLRKGKEAIILGKEAHPTFSRLITRSDDIQIGSVRESTELGREL